MCQNNSSQNNSNVDSSVYVVEVDDAAHFTPAVSTLSLPSTETYGACVDGN